MAEDVANVEQHEHWNTQSAHWVEFQDRYDALLAPLDGHLLEAAEISDRDHVLDVGCGCGVTTRAAARIAVKGDAVGIDLAEAMLERARVVAEQEGLTNARFVRGDAQVHEFDDGAFDLVISRFGVMFFADPEAAFANLARVVRDGGRWSFCAGRSSRATTFSWCRHTRPPRTSRFLRRERPTSRGRSRSPTPTVSGAFSRRPGGETSPSRR